MADTQDIQRVVEELSAFARERLPAARTDAAPREAATPSPSPRPLHTGSIPADTLRTPRDLAPYIDHTLLKPEATAEDVTRVAREAREHGFSTVCVNSSHVARVAEVLAGSACVPIAVVGFPLGACLTSAKVHETQEALRAGAREIDMVLAVGALKARDYALVLQDISRVVEGARPFPVKVILETGLLNDEEKIAACVLARAAGAAFVKTSTGFGPGGATVEDVALMRRVVGEGMGVKASGGIRSAEDALKMIRAGACRLGASASVAIVSGQQSATKY